MGSVCSTIEDKATPSSSRTAPTDEHDAQRKLAQQRCSEDGKHLKCNYDVGIGRRNVFSTSRLGETRQRNAPMPHKFSKTEADVVIVREVLREQTILSALSEYDLDEMIKYMEVVDIRPGQVVDLSGCLCVVLEGAVFVGCPSEPPKSREEAMREEESNRIKERNAFGQVGLVRDSFGSLNGLMSVYADKRLASLSRVCKLPGSAYRSFMEFSRQSQIKANMRLLTSIPIFSKLNNSERISISDSSQVMMYNEGDMIIREGEPGEKFYIVRTGGAVVTRGMDAFGAPARVAYKYPGDYFGEAALLADAPRNATVTVDMPRTEVLVIDKEIFNQQLLGPLQDIMERSETTCQLQMLVTVPLLSQLTAEIRMQLVKCLTFESFRDGEHIFCQNDIGDKLYIIISGEVSILASDQQSAYMSGSEQRELDRLYSGQYFGERALVNEEPRMASAIACGKVDTYSLNKIDFDNLQVRSAVEWSRRWDKEDTRDVSQLKVTKSLGSGAFGTAWLAVHQQTKRAYALKVLNKSTVKRQNWTSVVVREKNILAGLPSHPCVIAMYNSFQSPSQLFILMELATGGELFSLLEKFERFQPTQARFYAACVVLAIGHLHKHGVVFRDLKPENLLLTENGYLKLIDMGFAKQLGRGEKTYTLCGTPYYLAPEMILHRGHGFPLDWWCVGVLTYEMIQGEPPFTGTSEMEVYGKVTRMQYSCGRRFPDGAADFIIKMLKKEPEGRLGNLRNGVDDIMAHPWFYNQSWEQIAETSFPAPYRPMSCDMQPPKGSNKLLDLSDAMTNSNDYDYWPNW